MERHLKRIVVFLSLLIMVVLLAACGNTAVPADTSAAGPGQATAQPKEIVQKGDLQGLPDRGHHKSLVVYYSLTGHTKIIARHIHELVGGDIFELQTVQTYPTAHGELISQAKKELNADYLPELKQKLGNLDEYDTVFVGSPIWWGTDAPAVRTFLAQNNLAGKTVIPFVTHDSEARNGGPGSGIQDITAQAKQTKALEGMHFFEDRVQNRQPVEEWLKQLGLI